MSGDILTRFDDANVVAVAVSGDRWPRGFLSRTTIPDKWMGLVETRDGRRRFVPAGEEPRAGDDDRLILVRNRPLTLPLETAGAPGAEGNLIDASADVLVRWTADEADLGALAGSLLADGDLTAERLARALATAGGTAALQTFIRAHPASALVDRDLRDALLAHLREQLKRFTFETGVTLDRVSRLECRSESFRQAQARERAKATRLEQIRAREAVEAAAFAATQRRLDDLTGLLDKLRGAAAGDQQMRWHDLMPALSPAERGQLLENLWRITPNRSVAQSIVAVAGTECLWLDPSNPERVVQRVEVPPDLGGLRSIAFCPERNTLLVGAALGVWLLDAADGSTRAQFSVSGATGVRTGFNAAAIVEDRLYATHSQLGCWCWPLDAPGDGKAVLEPTDGVPKAVRAAAPTGDGRLVFSTDDCVQIYDPAQDALSVLSATDDVIHCLAVLDGVLYAGIDGGSVMRMELANPDNSLRIVHRSPDTVESVQPRRWNDLVELVVPAGRLGVSGLYTEEGVVARLLEADVPIRRAWASDDVVVGLADRRDRLIVMNANLPARTGREVSIGRLTGHSVQDACLVVTRESTGGDRPDDAPAPTA